MCPFRKRKCGRKQKLLFEEKGANEDIIVEGMEVGESCTYRIKAKNGSPAFKVTAESTATNGKVNITYVEFNEKKVKKGRRGKTATDAPDDDLPLKNSTFSNSGKQGRKGGQKKAKRRTADGEEVDGESIDEEK
jgi:hypothetical protein